uniref:Uncharacterized protein MANES_11G102000 n=1 Tax=Rhizophora mucronata TaxID=61149 RepID=A0A2P2KXE8_RHIMU
MHLHCHLQHSHHIDLQRFHYLHVCHQVDHQSHRCHRRRRRRHRQIANSFPFHLPTISNNSYPHCSFLASGFLLLVLVGWESYGRKRRSERGQGT